MTAGLPAEPSDNELEAILMYVIGEEYSHLKEECNLGFKQLRAKMCLEYILRKHFFRMHVFSKLLAKVVCMAALGVGLTIQFVSVFNEGHQYVALESILAWRYYRCIAYVLLLGLMHGIFYNSPGSHKLLGPSDQDAPSEAEREVIEDVDLQEIESCRSPTVTSQCQAMQALHPDLGYKVPSEQRSLLTRENYTLRPLSSFGALSVLKVIEVSWQPIALFIAALLAQTMIHSKVLSISVLVIFLVFPAMELLVLLVGVVAALIWRGVRWKAVMFWTWWPFWKLALCIGVGHPSVVPSAAELVVFNVALEHELLASTASGANAGGGRSLYPLDVP
eukprot:Skav214562  [mRNA]  locus=scaffold2080:20256:39559:+ [translate_table: standard]